MQRSSWGDPNKSGTDPLLMPGPRAICQIQCTVRANTFGRDTPDSLNPARHRVAQNESFTSELTQYHPGRLRDDPSIAVNTKVEPDATIIWRPKEHYGNLLSRPVCPAFGGRVRHSLKLWPLVLAMACSADLDSKDTADVIEPSVDCATEAPTAGAEVPLRRLTRAQLEATLLDSLNIVQAYPISDDELLGYRANTTSGLDTNTARTMQSAAEAVAVTLAPAVLRFEQCTDAGCADFLIDTAAPLLFRRPLPIEDRGPFYGVWDAGFEVGGRREAARWMLEAMLQSPRFLYQLETTDQEGWLDDYSVASRLSYALWGGPPDEFLLTAAAIGELHTDQQLTDAVDYFIESPK
ncbi:MAG: hypothetical protein ACI9MC_001721, partial [Kiritimatiellia bacterium]